MKLVRLVSLFAVAALPAFVFATPLTSSAIKGQVNAIVDGKTVPLDAGQPILPGMSIETRPGSELVVTLANGSRLLVGPNTRLRFRSVHIPETGLYSVEVLLVRGVITGDIVGGSASTFNIRTTSGVANVAGTSFRADFSPSVSGGIFDVASTRGVISLSPLNSMTSTSIEPGNQLSVSNVSSQSQLTPRAMSPRLSSEVNRALSLMKNFEKSEDFRVTPVSQSSAQTGTGSGSADGAGERGGSASESKPDAEAPKSDKDASAPSVDAPSLPNLGLISPNGEGNY